jgi:hypothetical protein
LDGWQHYVRHTPSQRNRNDFNTLAQRYADDGENFDLRCWNQTINAVYFMDERTRQVLIPKGSDMTTIQHHFIHVLYRYCLPFMVAVLTSFGIAAAAQAVCSPQELLAIARAGAACANLEPGLACYGSGAVGFTPAIDVSTNGLTQAGDRTPLRELASITVSPSAADDAPISIASMTIHTLPPPATDTLTVILLQSAALHSEVVPPAEMLLRATGALPVRVLPDADGEVITELRVNNGVIGNGRTPESEWVRVTVPETGEIGWVSAALVSAEGNLLTLPVGSPGDEVAQPFQTIHFSSNDSTACGGTLVAGALLQTPSTDLVDAITVRLNGMSLRLAGSAFLTERDNALTLIMLDGVAEVRVDTAQVVPAGAQITASLNAEGDVTEISGAVPYDETVTTALPINNLPRRFQVMPPMSQEEIDAVIAVLTMPTPTPPLPMPTAVDACNRSLRRDTTVWAGPGEDFEVLTELEVGTIITPVLATIDPLGATWWQLENSGWIEYNAVNERGNCSGLEVHVVVRVPPPPTNTYSLERCESFNGPVRTGQRVTFEFIPPAWDNYGAAREAVWVDPGRFIINADRYRATASDPFPLGTNVDPLEDRYLRRFTYVWIAQPGTYRITGDWLTYEPNCDLVVPVE